MILPFASFSFLYECHLYCLEQGSELDDFISGPRELLLKFVEENYPLPEKPEKQGNYVVMICINCTLCITAYMDYGVHFLVLCRRGRRKGTSTEEALSNPWCFIKRESQKSCEMET